MASGRGTPDAGIGGLGARSPPFGAEPGDFGLLSTMVGNDHPSPALDFWQLASAAVQIAMQLGGDKRSGSRGPRTSGRNTSGPRSSGEGFRTGDEERVPCTMNPNDRGCVPGPGPETQQSPNPETNPLNMDKAKEFLRDLGRAGEQISRRRICSVVITGVCSVGAAAVTGEPLVGVIFFLPCAGAASQVCQVPTQSPQLPGDRSR